MWLGAVVQMLPASTETTPLRPWMLKRYLNNSTRTIRSNAVHCFFPAWHSQCVPTPCIIHLITSLYRANSRQLQVFDELLHPLLCCHASRLCRYVFCSGTSCKAFRSSEHTNEMESADSEMFCGLQRLPKETYKHKEGWVKMPGHTKG